MLIGSSGDTREFNLTLPASGISEDENDTHFSDLNLCEWNPDGCVDFGLPLLREKSYDNSRFARSCLPHLLAIVL